MDVPSARRHFPMTDETALADLDIKAHGLREPIRLWDGAIIDGRNRELNRSPRERMQEAIAATACWRGSAGSAAGCYQPTRIVHSQCSTHTGPVNAAIWANYATPAAAIIGAGGGRADNSAAAPFPRTATAPAPQPQPSPRQPHPHRHHTFSTYGETAFSTPVGDGRVTDLRRDHRDSRNCARKRASLTSHSQSSFQGSLGGSFL